MEARRRLRCGCSDVCGLGGGGAQHTPNPPTPTGGGQLRLVLPTPGLHVRRTVWDVPNQGQRFPRPPCSDYRKAVSRFVDPALALWFGTSQTGAGTHFVRDVTRSKAGSGCLRQLRSNLRLGRPKPMLRTSRPRLEGTGQALCAGTGAVEPAPGLGRPKPAPTRVARAGRWESEGDGAWRCPPSIGMSDTRFGPSQTPPARPGRTPLGRRGRGRDPTLWIARATLRRRKAQIPCSGAP